MNKVILIGNAGKDAELRQFGENQVAKFTLATTKRYKNKTTGETETKSTWHNIEIWGSLAKVAGDYVKKGGKVAITGEIDYETYKDANGIEKHTTKIKADGLELLGGKPENSSGKATSTAKVVKAEVISDEDEDDETLPF